MNTNEFHTGHPLHLELPKKRTLDETLKELVEMEQRALKAEKKLEAFEYVVSFANDLVEMWPTVTMRTLWKVTEKIAFLKDALKQASN